MARYILHIEYAQNPGEHPVFIQLSDGKTMFGECAGKTLKRTLTKAVEIIMSKECGVTDAVNI